MSYTDKLVAVFREEFELYKEVLPSGFEPTWRCEYPESLGYLVCAEPSHVRAYFKSLRNLMSPRLMLGCYSCGEVFYVVVHGTGEAPPEGIKTFLQFRLWWTAAAPADPGKFSVRDFNLTFTPTPC